MIHRHLPVHAATAATAGLLALAVPGTLHAQAAFDGTTACTQDFNTLPAHASASGDNSGTTSFTFSNNSTLAGWYSSAGAGRASAGQQHNNGRIYSWGRDAYNSNPDAVDRALGIYSAEGFASTAYLGLQLQNTSGATIDSVTLAFDVEQWRQGASATTWTFSYLITASTGSQLTATGYTADARGDAASGVTGSAKGLNGNLDANKTAVSVTLTGLDWRAGEYLWFRWASDQPGSASAPATSAAGLGLDNLKVELTSAVPEPAAVALLAGSLVLLAGFAFRRRRAN
ncbi:MAG: PEP-CTERM sorting domain-containing protein [Opitutaceae bacterium]|jgi:hypothetical protein|nr:PEP-CTERM sorting domain-containing protein [Opitutaceae bacterium]